MMSYQSPMKYDRQAIRRMVFAVSSVIILVLTGTILYAPVVKAPFVLDDIPFIQTDPAIRMTKPTIDNIMKAAVEGQPRHRLLPNLSWAVNYYFGRYDVTGYHVVNIAIHLINGIILFFFFRATLALNLSRIPIPGQFTLVPFFAALLWLVHPISTQSVTYVCQRMTSMAALFYILSLFLYVKARIAQRSNPARHLKPMLLFTGCLASGLAAVASKENAAMLPIIILLYEWFFFQDLKISWSAKKTIWIFGVIIVFSIIGLSYLGGNPLARIASAYVHRDFTLPQRVMSEWRVVVYYISLFFFPAPGRLSLEHDYPLSYSPVDPWSTLFSLSAIFGLILLSIYSSKKHRLFSFCIIWFLGNLIIESSIVGLEIIFEHRTYLPFMMVSLMVVLTAERFIRPPKVLFCLLCGMGVLFSIWTYQRNLLWQDNIAFLEDCVNKASKSIRPRFNLSTELQLKGRLRDARRHLEEILARNPYVMGAYTNLANIWVAQDNIETAIDIYIAGLSLDPGKINKKIGEPATAYFNLGSILLNRRMIDEAVYFLEKGINSNPDLANAYTLAGLARMEQGQYEAAARHFREALRLNPDTPLARSSRSRLADRQLRLPGGLNDAVAAGLYPENIPLHLKLGNFYLRMNAPDRALIQYRKILKIDPSHAGALTGQAACSGAAGGLNGP